MSELPPVIEQADLMLARLAALDLRAAEHANACLLDTTQPDEVASLARAYARLSRCLRQTLAIHAKLKTDREKAEREREQHRPIRDLRELAVDERTAEVQAAVDRVISAAANGDEQLHTDWSHRFDREACDWMEKPDWITDDVDVVILRACSALDLPRDLAARWRDLPDPTFVPDPEPETPEEIAAANAKARAVKAGLSPAPPEIRLPPPWDKYENSA